MSGQAILAGVALAVPLVTLLAVLLVARRGRFQFSLQASLLWLVPLAAVLAWIMTWDGPLVTPRRVATHKLGLLIAVLNASVVVAMWYRGWLRPRAVAIMLLLCLLLFGWIAWKRHQDLPREQADSALP